MCIQSIIAGERTEEILCSASKCINLTLVNSWTSLGDGFLSHALSGKDSDGQGCESTTGSPKTDVYLDMIDPFRGLEIAFEILFSFDYWGFKKNILEGQERGFVSSHNPSTAFALIHLFWWWELQPSSCFQLLVSMPAPSSPCTTTTAGVIVHVHLTGELIWLEINVFFQQIVFQLGRLHDPCLCVASKSCASSVEGMQGQAWAPRGGKGWLNQAIAKHLTVTCSRTNRSSEDVAVTVYTAPGKRRAVRARARSPSSELYWSWQGDADLHHLRTCCTLSLCLSFITMASMCLTTSGFYKWLSASAVSFPHTCRSLF